MTDLTEQEVCIGSLGQQKVYLHWSDVKDICTYAVSAAYEQVREENTKLKELLEECKRQFEEVELCRYDIADTDQEDWFKISTEQAGIANKMIAKIDQALGEDK